MTALIADRDTAKKFGQRYIAVPAKDAAEAFEGGMLAVGADGFGVAASDTAGLRVLGRCAQGGDNSDGADGDITFTAEPGVFKYDLSAALEALGQAHVGKAVYVVDDQTVGIADDVDQLVLAGVLEEIDLDDAGAGFVAVGMGITPDAGALSFAGVAAINDAQVSTEVTVAAIDGLIRIDLPDAATATYTFITQDAIEIYDVLAIKDGAGAANTVQLTTGADVAITTALVFAVDATITRPTTLPKATRRLAAGATFKVVNTRAAGSSAGQLFLHVVKTD